MPESEKNGRRRGAPTGAIARECKRSIFHIGNCRGPAAHGCSIEGFGNSLCSFTPRGLFLPYPFLPGCVPSQLLLSVSFRILAFISVILSLDICRVYILHCFSCWIEINSAVKCPSYCKPVIYRKKTLF